MSAGTAAAATVHHPFGSPSGPGLFRMKGAQLPAYIQNIAHALLRSGSARDESSAIGMAVGICQRWAAGGGKVHPDVQAAAAKAISEWTALKAAAHAHANEAGGGMALTWNGQGIDLASVDLGGYLPPHVAAGSPAGGQFGTTSGGGGGSSGGKGSAGAKGVAAATAQKNALHAQATKLRVQAAAIEAQITGINATIALQVKATAAAKAKAAAPSVTAKAAAAVKKAATTSAAAAKAKTAAKKAPAAKKATLAQNQATVKSLHSKAHALWSQAAALDAQANAIKLSGTGASAVDLAGPGGWSHGWVRVADAINLTADKMAAGRDASPGGTGQRHDRVTQFLRSAATAARTGDHATALSMLGRARDTATGATARVRVPQVRVPGEGSAATSIDGHIKAVQAASVKSGAKPGVRKISAAESLRRKAAALAGGGSPFLELAFTEALADRVPPGRREGGQFAAAVAQLSRHDTPAQTARAVNAMDSRQRAMVRATVLVPPGFEWGPGDRLAEAGGGV